MHTDEVGWHAITRVGSAWFTPGDRHDLHVVQKRVGGVVADDNSRTGFWISTPIEGPKATSQTSPQRGVGLMATSSGLVGNVPDQAFAPGIVLVFTRLVGCHGGLPARQILADGTEKILPQDRSHLEISPCYAYIPAVSYAATLPIEALPPERQRAVPGRIGLLLGLVHTLIAYGRNLAATLQLHVAEPRLLPCFTYLATAFEISNLPLILNRITRGLLRAAALQERLRHRAAHGRDFELRPRIRPPLRTPVAWRQTNSPLARPGPEPVLRLPAHAQRYCR